MSGAHEKLEQAEHTAHSGDNHGASHKRIGLTMGLIGVLIAFCAAMVGSERNELTRAMIEQTQAHSDFTAASTKFRLIMIELEKQHARIAAGTSAPAGSSPVERFITLAEDYTDERTLSKAWADSYHPLVESHFKAAEGYENAQLIAEIGIVLASLGVLLASELAWLLSVILAIGCLVQLGRVYLGTKDVVRQTLVQIQHAEEAYTNLRKAHVGENQDENTIDRLDPDHQIRNGIEARNKTHALLKIEHEERK